MAPPGELYADIIKGVTESTLIAIISSIQVVPSFLYPFFEYREIDQEEKENERGNFLLHYSTYTYLITPGGVSCLGCKDFSKTEFILVSSLLLLAMDPISSVFIEKLWIVLSDCSSYLLQFASVSQSQGQRCRRKTNTRNGKAETLHPCREVSTKESEGKAI